MDMLEDAHATGRDLSSESEARSANSVRCPEKITISSAAWIWTRASTVATICPRTKSFEKNLLGGVTKMFKFEYQPMGFSWMIFADRDDFDRGHYGFKYVRREFLGDVRCLVFDITPKKDAGKGRFLGRIWVEDQEYNIVRLNGTYAPRPRNAMFFHMDSWRLNLIPGYWVPAYIYSEEGDFSYGAKDKMAFKAQSRIWGYDLKKGAKEDELTN